MGGAKLKFKKDLLKSNAKDLIADLQSLREELSKFEQVDVDLNSLKKVSKALVSAKFLGSQNAGVRAYTMSCLTDILRVFAPDAPYNMRETKEIFKLFIKEFGNLKNDDYAYFTQLYDSLERLVETQCIVLVVDIDTTGSMTEQIFKIFYDVVGKVQVQGLEFLLTAMLSQLIDELEVPPKEINQIILSHLLTESKRDGDGKEDDKWEIIVGKKGKINGNSGGGGINGYGGDGGDNLVISTVARGYNMSKTLCMDNVDIMTRVVNQYIGEILNPILSGKVSGDEVGKELEKLGNLIISIWKSVPELLVNILGQLEQNFHMENLDLRYMSTRVLGEIISFNGSRVNFVNEYHSIYKAWIGRHRDVSSKIRINWATNVPNFVKNQTNKSLLNEIVLAFLGLLVDPDEKVRICVCNLLSNVDIDTIATIYTVVVEQPLMHLVNRLRDKKSSVRLAAFKAVGKLYDEAYDQILLENQQIIDVFAWIPSDVLALLYINDTEVYEKLDWVLFDYIYSFSKMGEGKEEGGSIERAKRLLTIVKSLNDESFKAFIAINSRQMTVAKILNTFLAHCKEYHEINNSKKSIGRKKKESTITSGLSSDDVHKKIQSLIQWISKSYPEGNKISEHLNTFVDVNDRYCYKLMGICLNPDSDYKQVYDSYHQLIERLGKQPFVTTAHSSSTITIQSTFKSILYRSSFILFNKTTVSSIIDISRTNSHLKEISHVILKEIALIQPSLMKSQSQEITKIIENSQPGDNGLVDTLKTARLLFSKFNDLVPKSDEIWKSLVNIAKNGDIKEAKQAINVLDFAPKKSIYLTRLVDPLDNILALPYEEVPDNFSTLLSCISQLYYHNPEIIEPYSGLIVNFLLRNVLVANARPAEEGDPEWVDDKDDTRRSIVDYGKHEERLDVHLERKLLALKIMVNRARCPYLSRESALEVSKPILNLLVKLVVKNGEIARTADTPPHYKSRLRLEAGIKLLKLSKTEYCLQQIGPVELSVLGSLIKDEQLQVRDKFIHKFLDLLSNRSIPDRFLCLVFFIAGETNKAILEHTIKWITSRFSRQLTQQKNNMAFENAFVRVLHVLSHSGGIFEEYEDDMLLSLNRAAKYIIFYLKFIATEANISLLFYLSQRIKEYKDIVDGESNHLYIIADLAQICLLQLKEIKTWSIPTWPGKIQLPSDSFKPIKSATEATKIASTSYIPEDIETKVKETIRKELNIQHHKIKTEIKIEREVANPFEEDKEKSKKRSSLGNSKPKKKAKPSTPTASKFKSLTRANQESESIEPRRSNRVAAAAKQVKYASDEDDQEEDDDEEEEEEEEEEEDEDYNE